MDEWTVISVLVTLVGLGAAIIKPLMSLKGVITRLSGLVENLEDSMSSAVVKNREAHERIWERIDEQEGQLRGHEVRIMLMENKTAQ